MDKNEVLQALASLADELDADDMTREADMLTSCMKRVAYGPYNDSGEPIMDAASWRREQMADQEYQAEMAAGHHDDGWGKERAPTPEEALEEDLWYEEKHFWQQMRQEQPEAYAELEAKGLTGGALTTAAQEGIESGWLSTQSDWQRVYSDMVERALSGGTYEVPKDQSIYMDHGREDFGWSNPDIFPEG